MIALILSILIPGLGQFYYGKNVRAIFMVLFGLTPLYPAVLIWSIIDIIILNKQGVEPKYSTKQAFWGILLLVIVIPTFIFIVSLSIFTFGAWYSDNYVFPQQTMAEGRQIETAINDFFASNGYYPNSINDLIAGHPLRSGWTVDSWGNQYIYKIIDNGKNYKLISKGKDCLANTKDDIVFH